VAEDIHKPIKDGKPGKVVLAAKGEELTIREARDRDRGSWRKYAGRDDAAGAHGPEVPV